MAKIIGLKEKQQALKDINRKINSLQPVNEFLNADISAENPSGLYTLSFGEYKTTLLCKDANAIKALVSAYKLELVKDIKGQAEMFSIEFDPDEEAALELK